MKKIILHKQAKHKLYEKNLHLFTILLFIFAPDSFYYLQQTTALNTTSSLMLLDKLRPCLFGANRASHSMWYF